MCYVLCVMWERLFKAVYIHYIFLYAILKNKKTHTKCEVLQFGDFELHTHSERERNYLFEINLHCNYNILTDILSIIIIYVSSCRSTVV